MVMQGAELFIRPKSIDTVSGTSALLDSWWHYPLSLTKDSPTISPDPSLLRSQMEVVSVTSDLGSTTLDGDDMYHYEVTLDPVKLQLFLQRSASERQEPFDGNAVAALLKKYDARGELWIDATDFSTHRIDWALLPKKEAPAAATLRFRVDIRNVNGAPPIVVPKGAKPLSVTGGSLDVFPLPLTFPFLQGFLLTP